MISVHTIITIIVWEFAIVFLAAIIFFAFLYGRSTIKDNPKKAYIFLATGRHISLPIKGDMIGKPTKAGTRYKYANNEIIFVPTNYGEKYIKCRRAIFISRYGQLIASPFDDDVSLSEDEKNDLIYDICESHIGSDVMRFIKGKGAVSIIIVAIIAFVIGAAIVIGFTQFQKVNQQKMQQQPAQTQPVQPNPNIIEVK